MRRFALLSYLLLACDGTNTPLEASDMIGVPPWHMWGNQLAINLVATGAPADVISSQLVNINYGRPETWTWLMWYQIVACSNPGAVGLIQVRFNLTVGVGRTKVTLPDFLLFINGPPLPGGGTIYATTTLDDQNRVVSDIVGQDIILNVNSIITGGVAPGTTLDLNVGAMFAPKSHVRPEWWEGQFRGEENNGR
jgi:hypothetical protein